MNEIENKTAPDEVEDVTLDFRKAIEPLAEKAAEEKPTSKAVEEQFQNVKTVVGEKVGEVRKSIGQMEAVVVEKAGAVTNTIMEKAGECRKSIGEMIEKRSHHEEEEPKEGNGLREETSESEKTSEQATSTTTGSEQPPESKVEVAKEWVVHKVEDLVNFIACSPPKNTDGSTKKRLSKDLVQIIPGVDKAEVHTGLHVGFEEKVERARETESVGKIE